MRIIKLTRLFFCVLSQQNLPILFRIQTMASKSEFANTLKEFGYGFNDEGMLRQLDKETGQCTDLPFEFKVSADQKHNQKRYEALGELITQHVYELLEHRGLHKIYIPSNIPESAATFVFSTKKDLTNVKKLLILIHGSGVVRAGQWARKLIINESINHGTQIPYIDTAKGLGYEVLILNTNDNQRNGRDIPGHSSPTTHAISVWTQLVANAKIESIAIVAHSYGGVVAMDLTKKHGDAFRKKVFAVALTDSVHGSVPESIRPHMQKIGRNYVASSKALNTPSEYQQPLDVQRLSAGHSEHEYTSWSAMKVVFEFIEKQYQEFIENGPTTKRTKTEL